MDSRDSKPAGKACCKGSNGVAGFKIAVGSAILQTMSDPVQEYRPAQRALGRKIYLVFEAINTVSFNLLTGNLIVLLLLRFGADTLVLGLVQAFPYLSFQFMPFSKRLVPKLGLVRTFGYAWILRYIFVVPVVIAPFVVMAGHPIIGILLVLGGYSLFQILRGFGMISNSPLLQALSAGKDRGAYLSQKNIIVNAAALVAGVIVSISLGSEAPLERYSLLLGLGVTLGFVGCMVMFRLPEPPAARFGVQEPFFSDVHHALRDPGFMRFAVPFFLFIFVGGLGRSFLVVYAKQVYNFGDNTTMVLTVVGGLGAILMGFFSRVSLDRIGGKPMFILFNLGFLVSMVPLVLFGALGGPGGWILLAAVFFLSTLGGAGGENAANVYFFSIVGKERQFNMGIFYFLILGFAGVSGSFLGGAILQSLPGWTGLDTVGNYRLFFAFTLVIGLVSLGSQFRMERRGNQTVRQAIATLFSFRNLRAMSLLRRLDQSRSPEQEEQTLSELADNSSPLAIDDLLKRLNSPIFAIRNRALFALEDLTANRSVEDALIKQVEDHQFATAYRAARILGRKNCQRAIPSIRAALESDDYLLQAYSVNALADLGDRESRERIETLLVSSENTLVMVHCIGALKVIGNTDSFVALLSVLRRPQVSPHMRDEVIFGISGVLGMENWLYGRYIAFLDDTETGVAMLLDDLDAAGFSITAIEASIQGHGRDLPLGNFLVRVHRLVRNLSEDIEEFTKQLRPILLGLEELGFLPEKAVKGFLDTWDGEQVRAFIRFRFFLAALAVFYVSRTSKASAHDYDDGGDRGFPALN